MNFSTMNLADFLEQSIECECGRTHHVQIDTVEIGTDALRKVSAITKKNGYKKPFIIADANTYAIAGKQLLEQFTKQDIPHSFFVFEQEELAPDERAIGSLLINFDPTCDLIIGVGSGTINDISRFVSHRLGLQYYIVATAPQWMGTLPL